MICSSCGTQNEVGRKFCRECGTRLATGCPNCGAQNPPDAKFCGECGTALAGAIAGAPAGTIGTDPGAAAAPRSAPHLAERRLVSVLFADLVGFTPFAEERDPEETRELLSAYFELARDVIERYGGTVEKFIGDAVMAIWGAPTAREDDAERAVRAGLELVDAVHVLGPTIQARAGVLTGEAAVTVGAVGEGMVAGDLVNTAARLQGIAEPGTVLVGEATQRATSAAVVFEPVGETTLKGKTSPVPAWRALRIVAERGGRGRSDVLEAPFVGRDTEFRLLKELFHATGRDQRTRLVTVIGQGGIGKSRLGWEFLKYIDGLLETVWWHSGRAPAYGDGITFWALGEMIRSRCGLAETDDEATTRVRVAETVARFVADPTERTWIEESFLALLGVGDPVRTGTDQLFAAWRTFFERIAAQGTVVLLFEDLQWADAGLLDFIENLLEWSRDAPIFVVALARPELLERRSEWATGRRGLVSMALEPLDDGSMRQLLAGLVPGLPAAAATTIVARADGIPLYAVETVRMLVAEGRLVPGEGGGYEPTGDLSTLAVPESLQALIAARLDALPPADRSLLQDAAVLGQSFTLAAVAAVSGDEPESLAPRLRSLARRELLRQEADPRSPERGQFAFVQSLIREVAYGQLARSDRKSRHVAAARYFESLETDELAGALAAHYLAARDNAAPGPEQEALAAQARVALRGAADRAIALGAQAQAVGFLRQAISVTTDQAERADLLERAGRAATAAFLREEAIDFLAQGIAVRRTLGDRPAILRSIQLQGRNLLDIYDIEHAIGILESATTEFDDLAGSPEHAAVVTELARGYYVSSRPERAIELTESVLPTLEHLNLVEALSEAMITKGSSLATIGRNREGTAILRGGLELARSHGLAASEIRARVNLVSIWSYEDPIGALAVGRDGMELAARLGMRARQRSLLVNVAAMAVATGEWDWILRIADDAMPADEGDVFSLTSLFLTFPVALARGLASQVEVERAIASLPGLEDANTVANALDLRAELDLVEGRLPSAYERQRELADLDPFSRVYGLWQASQLALLMRDLDRARETVGLFRAAGAHGRFLDASRVYLEAGIAALEGRRAEAVAAFRDAHVELEELAVPWIISYAQWIAALTLGPDDPIGSAAASEARAIMESLGAVRTLDRLDATLAEARAEIASGTRSGVSAGRETLEGVG